MRRIDKNKSKYLDILSEKRFRKRISRRKRFYDMNKPPPYKHLFSGEVIAAPADLNIYNVVGGDSYQFREFTNFIEKISDFFGKKDCAIDFSKTTRMSASATIILYAAVESAYENGFCKGVILWSKEAPSVNRAIKHYNLEKVIRRQVVRYNFAGEDILPVISSYGNKYMEDIVDYIQRRVYQDKMDPEVEYVFGDAVSETINNVGLHAYPNEAADSKRWWLACQLIGKDLYLAIYDRGVGIPRTVVDRTWFPISLEKHYPDLYKEISRIAQNSGSSSNIKVIPQAVDSELIYISMQGDVSGTKKGKHGQGSKSIHALVDECDNGKLWVFSNKGLYNFCRSKELPVLVKLPGSIHGTLVQWNIRVS